jgi:hypothetical protein
MPESLVTSNLIYNLREIFSILGVDRMKIGIKKTLFPFFKNKTYYHSHEWIEGKYIFIRSKIIMYKIE